jgi:DNA-binding NarL/FixJ family response regulator
VGACAPHRSPARPGARKVGLDHAALREPSCRGPWIERVVREPAMVSQRSVEPPRPYPNRLSEREVQVLRLIAAGQSNREIAEALFISRHTVERHVNHIFTKTGATNRTQVAIYAHEQMLLVR